MDNNLDEEEIDGMPYELATSLLLWLAGKKIHPDSMMQILACASAEMIRSSPVGEKQEYKKFITLMNYVLDNP